MDQYQFIAALSDALAWPIAAILIALSQRKPISRLIDRAKNAKLFGADLDFGEQVASIREEIEDQQPALPPPQPDVDAPQLPSPENDRWNQAAEELARSSATGTITLAWLELEDGMKKIAETNGVGWMPTNFIKNVRNLKSHGYISEKNAEAVLRLRTLRNSVSHDRAIEVSIAEAQAYRDTVREILQEFGINSGNMAWR